MTILRVHRSSILALVLVGSLFLTWAPPAAHTAAPGATPMAEVVGSLPMPALGCIGCVVGGGLIAASGWGAVWTAAAARGSAYAVLACSSMCWRAITL